MGLFSVWIVMPLSWAASTAFAFLSCPHQQNALDWALWQWQ
jgi:hypothetical protein